MINFIQILKVRNETLFNFGLICLLGSILFSQFQVINATACGYI
jgi:hypothetical protein